MVHVLLFPTVSNFSVKDLAVLVGVTGLGFPVGYTIGMGTKGLLCAIRMGIAWKPHPLSPPKYQA